MIAASAGNHAQGVALAAGRLEHAAVIVMPRTTPQIKVDAVRNLGGEVVLHGDNYDAAYAHALRHWQRSRKLTFVHPYDDPEVIAGQGTIGMEILKQQPGAIDAIFVPVGGGGLIAGIAAYIKQMRPEVKIIGVEPEDADAMDRSLKAGKRMHARPRRHLRRRRGGAPGRQGNLPAVPAVRGRDGDRQQRRNLRRDQGHLRGPPLDPGAGRRARLRRPQALRRRPEASKDKNLVAIASGANMNFDRLRYVAERAEIGERREAILAVTIPERPGALKKFCAILGDHSVTEFNYRFSDPQGGAYLRGLQVRDGREDRAARRARCARTATPRST